MGNKKRRYKVKPSNFHPNFDDVRVDLENEPRKRGRPTSDKKTDLIQVRVNNDLYRFVSRNAMVRDISESEFIRSVLQEKLDEELERARLRKQQMAEERQRKLEEMREKGMFFFS